MRPYLLFFVLSVLMLLSCKPASYTLKDYKGKKLTISNGGGFTGQLIDYTVFENGQVFRSNSLTGTVEEKTRLKKVIVDQIFINYDFLNLKDIEMNSPGNMYFSIVMENEDSNHKLLWNHDISEQIDKNVRLFYQTCMSTIKE